MFRIRLKELREAKGMSQYAFAKDFGVAQSTVGNWERGKREPNYATTQRLADYFDVSVDYLLGRDEMPKLPLNMRPLMESTVAMIPIVSTVRAGFGGVPEPVYDGTMAVYDRKNPQECVWMKVEGDSMSPDIKNGDYVLVHIQPTAENGDIIVAIWNGEEGTVKKYQRDDNGVMLIPLNTQYPARFITNAQLDEFIIYGVVKETKRILG